MSEVMEVPTTAAEPGVSFGETFTESPPYLGTVVVDTEVPSAKTPSGRQIQYTIKPLDFETKGAGITTYVNVPVKSTQRVRQQDGTMKEVSGYSKRSGMYIVMEAWRRVHFSHLTAEQLKALALGRGQILGVTGWFKRVEVKFGQDEQGNPISASYQLPIAKATEAELATAGQSMPVVPSMQAAPSFSADDLAKVVEFIAGKTPVQYQKAAFRDQTLPQNIKDGIANGTAITAARDAGLIQVDGDGMVTRLGQS